LIDDHTQGYACPQFTNPADYYMRLISRSESIPEEKYVARIEGLDAYHKQHNNIVPIEGHKIRLSSLNGSKIGHKAEELEDGSEPDDEKLFEHVEFKNEKLPKLKKASPRFAAQFMLLLSRSWTQYIRDPGTYTLTAHTLRSFAELTIMHRHNHPTVGHQRRHRAGDWPSLPADGTRPEWYISRSVGLPLCYLIRNSLALVPSPRRHPEPHGSALPVDHAGHVHDRHFSAPPLYADLLLARAPHRAVG
jgi:hypothetical protein